MALDALTISPFFVIDDKLVEVSTGIKVCEIVKDLSIVFVSSRKAPPEDVHISILLLNANAHGRLYLRSSSSTYEDKFLSFTISHTLSPLKTSTSLSSITKEGEIVSASSATPSWFWSIDDKPG